MRASVSVATVSAVGVASDNAQGQATTSTETKIHSAREGSIRYQATPVPAASTSRVTMK